MSDRLSSPVAVPYRDTATSDTPPPSAVLWTIGVVEAVSFVALVATAMAGHSSAARAGLGFLHGCVYLLSLGFTWWRVDDSRARNLAVIPGIGALLVARRVGRTRNRPAPVSR